MKEIINMDNKELLSYAVTISAFAFFIVCPRMAAMTNILSRNTTISIYWIVVVGTLVSIPLLVLTAWAIRHWGLMAGLAIAIVTDIFAAALLTSVSLKAALETFIIAIFVVAGNRFAMWVSSRLL
jgi:hypothetical protein